MFRLRPGCSSLLLTLTVATTALADDVPAQDNPGKVPILSPASMNPVMIDAETPAKTTRNLWLDDRLVLEAQGSLGGPLGMYGLAADYSLSKRFVLNAGVGVGRGADGSSLGQRLQFAVTPRIRFPLSDDLDPLQLAFGFEAGLSEGSYRPLLNCVGSDSNCTRRTWSHVLWLNTHATFELRYWSLQLRFFSGVGSPLASEGIRNCSTQSGGGSFCSPEPPGGPKVSIHVGASVGVALF